MAIDLNSYTKVISNEYFDGYNAQNGKDVVLTPKNKGKLTFDGNIEIPGSVIEGGVTRDDNGNVNLGVDEGVNKNEFSGSKSVAVGMHHNVGGDNNIVSGNNNTTGENSLNSAIIGGQNNTNDKVGSVILGGYNITATKDNTTYTPDLAVKGNIVFGIDDIALKRYGEFDITVDEHEQRSLSHPLGQRTAGMYKLTIKGTSGIKVTIYDTEYTLDGTWQEFMSDTPEGALLVEFDGSGSVSYIMEVYEVKYL